MSATEGRSGQRGFARFQASASGAALLHARPSLRAAVGEGLAALPAGTLGRAYHDFMAAHGFSVEGMAELGLAGGTRPMSRDERWFTERMNTLHDVRHVVAGYGQEPLGELCLLAFRYAQTGHPGMGFFAVVWGLKIARAPTRPTGRRGGAGRLPARPPRRLDGRPRLGGDVTPAAPRRYARGSASLRRPSTTGSAPPGWPDDRCRCRHRRGRNRGSATAAALASLGLSVLIIEPGQHDDRRLAGELIHPAGVTGLADLGLLASPVFASAARLDGFSIFPEAGPAGCIQLPYHGPAGEPAVALALDHASICQGLLAAVAMLPRVSVARGWRVTVWRAHRVSRSSPFATPAGPIPCAATW